MNELHAILDAWRRGPTDCGGVLATVVHVTGSAYRRPGARMLVLPDGRRLGSVSGGCLEGELVKRAWWLTRSDRPVMKIYDTSSDDDAVWEFGLGCNGVVHVLLERACSQPAAEMLEFLDAQRQSGASAVVAAVVATRDTRIEVGARLLVDACGAAKGALAASAVGESVLQHALLALEERTSRLIHLSAADLFVEFVASPLQVMLFGAGHDAVPLVRFAAEMGWQVTVADGRPAYARPERFPGANRVVVMRENALLSDLTIDSETVVVLMTHNFPMDTRLVPLVLERRPKYLGLLGPRHRAEKLFRQFGKPVPGWVHAPVGLDIGCETPEAIALSIAADIQAAISDRKGGGLRFRSAAIHAPAAEVGSSFEPSIVGERPAYCETAVGSNV